MLKFTKRERDTLPDIFRVGEESKGDGAPIQDFQTDVIVHSHEDRFQVARIARVNLPVESHFSLLFLSIPSLLLRNGNLGNRIAIK